MNDFGKYAYLIDEVCKTKNNKIGKTADNVRKILPVLIGWAKRGFTDKTYSDLSYEALGYKIYSGIGLPLGCVYSILEKLGKAENENIPNPNLLVNSKSQGIPSDGLSWVLNGYEGKSYEKKEEIKSQKNLRATTYKNWDWVLHMLGLKECVITDEETSDISKAFSGGFGGEGEEHKALKNFIASNPSVLKHKINTWREDKFERSVANGTETVFVTLRFCVVRKQLKATLKPNAAGVQLPPHYYRNG